MGAGCSGCRMDDGVGEATRDATSLLKNPTSEKFKAEDFSLDSDYEVKYNEKLPMVV